LQIFPIFQTNRLLVRRLTLTDLLEFSNLHGDDEVMFYTETNGIDAERSLLDFNRIIQQYDAPDNKFWIWAIENKFTHDFIGICVLSINSENEIELGYRLNKKFWRLGIGSEVFNGLVKHAFENEHAESVSAEADSFNIASLKIIEKHLNFVSEYYNTELKRLDYLYKLSKQEYFQIQNECA
jgi:ribosomal-protein-alanine N-acetyltransferase